MEILDFRMCSHWSCQEWPKRDPFVPDTKEEMQPRIPNDDERIRQINDIELKTIRC
jgi:hypothetical protein